MKSLMDKELKEFLLMFDKDNRSDEIAELLFNAGETNLYRKACRFAEEDDEDDADVFTEIAGHGFDLALNEYRRSQHPHAGSFIGTYFDCNDDEFWVEYLLDSPEHISIIEHAVINKRRFNRIIAAISSYAGAG